MRLTMTVTALLPLAACGGGARGSPLDDGQQRVMAMAEGERNVLLAEAVRRGHRPCREVVQSRAIEPAGPIPTYVARCADGDSFVVFIRRDGKSDIQLTSNPS